jgi:cytosine/adenosine deaminase-related metal-dependent hydrolase
VRVFDGTRVIGARPTCWCATAASKPWAPGIAVPEGAQVIDGSGKTLLPGLIDAHAHVWTRDMLKQQLMFGVTTVLDMFTEVTLRRRNAQGAEARARLRIGRTCIRRAP